MPNRTSNRFSSDFEDHRQRTIDILTQAFASDAIGVEEYEALATSAAAADSVRELDALVSDLPALKTDSRRSGTDGTASRSPRPAHTSPADSYPAYPSGGASTSVACVMADRRMTGNWLNSDRVHSFTLMGSTRLDLRDADLPESGPIRIEAFVLMGETVVIVPRDLPVRLNAMPFMGEAVARRDVNQSVRGARRWVEVSGLVVMGSVVVKAAD